MVQSWTNADGLTQIFGPDKATPKRAGEYVTVGQIREVKLTLSLADLTETEAVMDDTVFLPAGVRIQEVEVITETAAATGTAIDVGLIRTDRSTELDYDGLLAAFPTANMNVDGETHNMRDSVTIPTGATGTGALIGTTLANKGYITASRTDATAFTAGKVHIKVKFYRP